MKPYYQDDWVTIYHGDCREIVPSLGRFDLLLTDPPYGIGNFVQVTGNIRGVGSGIGKSVEWNERAPSADVFEMLRGICKYRIIWGANFFNCFDGAGGAIVWIKNQPMPNFSKAEIASCSFYKKTEIVEVTWHNFEAALKKESSHPCERPVDLYLWCIKYAPNPQSILDPFMGSGTTLRAAKDLQRHAVGIEIEEKYCEIAARRCSQEVLAL